MMLEEREYRWGGRFDEGRLGDKVTTTWKCPAGPISRGQKPEHSGTPGILCSIKCRNNKN